MKGDKYLSIDMDFWNFDSPESTRRQLWRILKILTNNRVPIVAVMNHQQMLRFVNESYARILVNLDTHSDLADDKVDFLNCGTWVSFVKWRKVGHYRWYHKASTVHGECNGDDNIFYDRNNGVVKELSDWNQIDHYQVKRMPNYQYLTHRVAECGLCLSPDFVRSDLEGIFREAIKVFDIPYIKGRRREDYSRKTIPPTRQRKVCYV